MGEDKNKKIENFKEDKANNATSAIDRNVSQTQPTRTATSASNVKDKPDAVLSHLQLFLG